MRTDLLYLNCNFHHFPVRLKYDVQFSTITNMRHQGELGIWTLHGFVVCATVFRTHINKKKYMYNVYNYIDLHLGLVKYTIAL